MRAFITGISGFVGPYLQRELESHGYEVYGADLHHYDEEKIFKCDITDFDSVFSAVSRARPDVIFHLAGFSSVAKSFEDQDLCFKINVEGTRNLLEAVKKLGIRPKMLIVSSSEVYGAPGYNPIDEKHPLSPSSPYGKSRVAQEELCKGYDLPIIISRSFNHTGPGQQETFVIPSFKKQISEASDPGTVMVGNIDVIRDFSDVRDVVKAYRILAEKGKDGEIYNVGSGIAYNLREVLQRLINASGKKITIKIDEGRVRKNDMKEIVCDNRKLMGIEKISFRRIDQA